MKFIRFIFVRRGFLQIVRTFSLMYILLFFYQKAMSQQDLDQKLGSLLKGSVPFIYTGELMERMNRQEKLIIFDTRKPKEYDVSHISGAIFINYDNFNSSMVENFEKDSPIIVYCTVGYRSEKIGEKLKKLGFENVHNLYGGIFEWKNNGHEVVNASGVTDSVHTYNKDWSKWLLKGVRVYE